jgi:hypothetical protein
MAIADSLAAYYQKDFSRQGGNKSANRSSSESTDSEWQALSILVQVYGTIKEKELLHRIPDHPELIGELQQEIVRSVRHDLRISTEEIQH